MLIKVIHIVAILLFYCCDLVSLITFEWTILHQSKSCFSGKNLRLVFQSVKYLCFKNVRGKGLNKNGQMKGNGVVVSVYEFPLLL